MRCKTCNHQHAETFPELCTLFDCKCDENDFEPETTTNISSQSFEYYVSRIARLTDVEDKIRYMLEVIPGMRNTDDWQFVNQYWHYHLGFCVGMPYTNEVYNKIHTEAQPDSITRMRRKICQPDHQAIVVLQDEMKDDEITEKDGRYWEIKREIKRIIDESKYLPTDVELLRAKGIKEDATKEAVLLSSS